MPELPEIETIKEGLLGKVLNKLVLRVEINNVNVIRNRKNSFKKALERRRFVNIERRGKMLIFEIEKGKKETKRYFLLARMGMTGRLVYFSEEDALWGENSFKNKKSFSHKHCHIIFKFKEDAVMLFCDIRRFGYMEVVGEKELEDRLAHFGSEPLSDSFTLSVFRNTIKNKKTTVKAFLLNQRYVAGIGNIYADEILFEAGVRPCRVASSLSAEEVKVVYKSIKKILRKAVVNRGTTFSDYVDSDGKEGGFKKYLKVYGRGGEKCLNCKAGNIKKIRVAGRGTCFCEYCQK
ncbi:MAG: bifunctional DNA-formamidopyrimidine glycosylase/DNA-(apurinic or apyrimidinic site) lyase [Candidatus Paceibacterota bacterium]